MKETKGGGGDLLPGNKETDTHTHTPKENQEKGDQKTRM